MNDKATAPTTGPAGDKGPARSLSLLASQHFGSNFVGEVPEPSAGDPGDEAGTDDNPGDEAGSDDDADGAPAEGDGEDGDEAPITSFDELVAHQGWDPDWAQSLEIAVKVDGKPATVPLSDLVKNHQINAAADHRLEEAKARAKTQTEAFAEKEKQLETQVATAARLIESAEQLLEADETATDWNRLRQDDPGEYSAKRADLDRRKAALEQAKQETIGAYQQLVENREAETRAYLEGDPEKEAEALQGAIPEWADPKTAQAEQTQLAKYLSEQGFDDQDVARPRPILFDHRLLVMARKAMLFDQGQKKVAAAKKKLAKVPKAMKPGAPKPQDQRTREKVDSARKRLRQTGSVDDALAVLRAKRGTRK